MAFIKILLKKYYLIVGILSVLISVVAISHYGMITILFGVLFATLLGVIPYFQFNSILKVLNELKNGK